MTRLRMDFVRHVRHANIMLELLLILSLPVQLRGILFEKTQLRKR